MDAGVFAGQAGIGDRDVRGWISTDDDPRGCHRKSLPHTRTSQDGHHRHEFSVGTDQRMEIHDGRVDV